MAENSNYDEYEEKDVHDVAEEDMPGPPSPDVNAENGEEIIVHEPKSENETTTTDGDSSTPPPAPVVHKVLRPEDQMRLYVWVGFRFQLDLVFIKLQFRLILFGFFLLNAGLRSANNKTTTE